MSPESVRPKICAPSIDNVTCIDQRLHERLRVCSLNMYTYTDRWTGLKQYTSDYFVVGQKRQKLLLVIIEQ